MDKGSCHMTSITKWQPFWLEMNLCVIVVYQSNQCMIGQTFVTVVSVFAIQNIRLLKLEIRITLIIKQIIDFILTKHVCFHFVTVCNNSNVMATIYPTHTVVGNFRRHKSNRILRHILVTAAILTTAWF